MNKNDKYKLRYWYINGERYNSATEAAAKCNMTRYAVKKVCGRTRGLDGNFIEPQKGCYSKVREWSDAFEEEDIVCKSCGKTFKGYINPHLVNGTTQRQLCDICRKLYKNQAGRNVEELNEIHYQKVGTRNQGKTLTREEIKEIQHLCTPPIQRKRTGNFTIPI